VGIIGFGRTGRAVARRLPGWDVRILAHDPYVEKVPEELQGLVASVELEMLLTPHNLPHSREGLEANMRMFMHNVLELAAGRVPAQVVNKRAILTWQQRFAVSVKH
jgi:D-isomer specific 2-hydroxyacid dehydrogenase, NAD binding domain